MIRLIHPVYFPNILSYALMTTGDKILFEVSDFYEKQTYRNRMYIQSANGKQMLTVPVKHTRTDGKQIYKDVLISYDFNWQKLHWRSLETAYRTSPYFEFYEDDLKPLFEKKFRFLVELNLETFQIINDLLELQITYELTETYREHYNNAMDIRFLKNAKNEPAVIKEFPQYTQMFFDRHDFMPNLSILDLIFMEGPNAVNYLEQIRTLWYKAIQKFL